MDFYPGKFTFILRVSYVAQLVGSLFARMIFHASEKKSLTNRDAIFFSITYKTFVVSLNHGIFIVLLKFTLYYMRLYAYSRKSRRGRIENEKWNSIGYAHIVSLSYLKIFRDRIISTFQISWEDKSKKKRNERRKERKLSLLLRA